MQAASLVSLIGGLIADWLLKEKQWDLVRVRTFSQNCASLGQTRSPPLALTPLSVNGNGFAVRPLVSVNFLGPSFGKQTGVRAAILQPELLRFMSAEGASRADVLICVQDQQLHCSPWGPSPTCQSMQL